MANLIEQYESIELKVIQEYIEAQQEENLQLEFKELSEAKNFDRDDRKNLAKALSGFANSAGGILIWGITARKNSEGIDCANELKPIQNLGKIMTLLNELTGQLVTPMVDGVRHEKIELTDEVGFIKTLVPQSDSGPHMARGGEQRYFKRSGGSFYQMEHFDLEDMFGRRKKPALKIETRVVLSHTTTGFLDVLLIIMLRNIGRGLAKFPYFTIAVQEPYSIDPMGLAGNYRHGLPRAPTGPLNKFVFSGDSNSVIHVNSTIDTVQIRFQVDLINKCLRTGQHMTDLVFEYELAADEIALSAGQYKLPLADLLKTLNITAP